MTITKEVLVNHISVLDYKRLQIIGSTIVKDGEEIIAENEMAFFMNPDDVPSDRSEYQALPASEQAKVDDLTALWTDEVKAAWTAKQAERTP